MIPGSVLLHAEPLPSASQATSPSDRIRFGMVGIGMEGSNVLATAIRSRRRVRSRRRSLRRPP